MATNNVNTASGAHFMRGCPGPAGSRPSRRRRRDPAGPGQPRMKWAPLAVFTLFVAISVAWLGRDPALRRWAYGPGSSLGTGSDGTSLARAYLQASGARVSTSARPLAQASLPPRAVLLRIDPAGARDRPPPSMEAAPAEGGAPHTLFLAVAGGGRTVVFDGHVQGVRDEAGVLVLLRDWGLGPALLVGALALCAAFWGHAVTVGPPADPWRDPRAESVELVDSMAALYLRALSPAEALQLYRTRLLHEIALRLGVGEKRAEAVLREYAPDQPQDRVSDREFRAKLERLVSACERFRDEHRRGRS